MLGTLTDSDYFACASNASDAGEIRETQMHLRVMLLIRLRVRAAEGPRIARDCVSLKGILSRFADLIVDSRDNATSFRMSFNRVAAFGNEYRS